MALDRRARGLLVGGKGVIAAFLEGVLEAAVGHFGAVDAGERASGDSAGVGLGGEVVVMVCEGATPVERHFDAGRWENYWGLKRLLGLKRRVTVLLYNEQW
jgi:hypothetical protein